MRSALFRRLWQERRHEFITIVGCLLAVLGLWVFWHSDSLVRPESGFSGGMSVGIGAAAAPDTRVFFAVDPWNDFRRPTLRIVLGQSKTEPPQTVPFQIVFRGFLTAPDGDRCRGDRTENTCWSGDGVVTEERGDGAETVISGTFLTSGLTSIETSPWSLGAARSGPYRSFYSVITDVAQGDLEFPGRGVEVGVASGIGSDGARYEGFFPGEPYRLYPDGWAWLLAAPGGPIGTQITDTALEERLRRRTDIAGLLMGVFLALGVQAGYELARRPTEVPGVAGP